MKVQKVRFPDGQITWMVIGENFLPIEPIQEFLDYLRNVGRSPNTVKSYAYHLKLYWDYLKSIDTDWRNVGIVELADFMSWLRYPSHGKVVSMQEQNAVRTESTVNAVLTSVCMLYDFQERTGKVDNIPLYRSQVMPGRRYKGFLHHITKSKPTRTRLLKLKQPKLQPKTISTDQVQEIIDSCNTLRDKFLVCLLHESGMRIGQALGLRHEDIHSWDNLIKIIPRKENVNHARAKSISPYEVNVSKDLMSLYSEYLQQEIMELLGDDISDYVFVNLWDGKIGSPMTYSNVMDLFNRLKRKTGIAIHPHILRHTHATELIHEGVGMAYVQKRLGHASVQTTINTYVHVSDDDMKREYNKYLDNRYDTESTTNSGTKPR